MQRRLQALDEEHPAVCMQWIYTHAAALLHLPSEVNSIVPCLPTAHNGGDANIGSCWQPVQIITIDDYLACCPITRMPCESHMSSACMQVMLAINEAMRRLEVSDAERNAILGTFRYLEGRHAALTDQIAEDQAVSQADSAQTPHTQQQTDVRPLTR